MSVTAEAHSRIRHISTWVGAGIGAGIGGLQSGLTIAGQIAEPSGAPHAGLIFLVDVLTWMSLGAAGGRLWPAPSGLQSRPRPLPVIIGIGAGVLLPVPIASLDLSSIVGDDDFLIDSLSTTILFAVGLAVGILWRTRSDHEVMLTGRWGEPATFEGSTGASRLIRIGAGLGALAGLCLAFGPAIFLPASFKTVWVYVFFPLIGTSVALLFLAFQFSKKTTWKFAIAVVGAFLGIAMTGWDWFVIAMSEWTF